MLGAPGGALGGHWDPNPKNVKKRQLDYRPKKKLKNDFFGPSPPHWTASNFFFSAFLPSLFFLDFR